MKTTKLLQTLEQKYRTECELMQLADNMVASASDMKGQNYEILLQTRQEFKEKLHEALSGTVTDMPFSY